MTELKNLYTALTKVQSKLKPVQKKHDNPFFKSKYADLTDLWESARGLLAENGLCIIQTFAVDTESNQYLVTILAHSSGEAIESRTRIITAKNDAQSFGSAVTYLRRFSFGAIIGLTAGDDDDGEAASHSDNRAPNPEYKSKQSANATADKTKAKAHYLYPSEKQIKRLWAIAADNGWTNDDVHGALAKAGITSTTELPNSRYEGFCKHMEDNPKKSQTDLIDDDLPDL